MVSGLVSFMLAHLNTPIQRWNLPGIPQGVEVFIKRDDMTGSTLSGNKVRKLEFLFADAIEKGCKHVITCGGVQSNHCRATTVAAVELGIKPHLILRAGIQNVDDVGCQGNLLLNRMCGARMYFVPTDSPYETQLKPRMECLVKKIKSETGEDSYLMPVGGSTPIGLFGYLEAFNELISQGLSERFDDVVVACGSVGTVEGLALGNYLTGSKVKIHAISVSDESQDIHSHANINYKELGFTASKSEGMMDVDTEHIGEGYGISTQEELDFILSVSSRTGIILDPTYTGKAAKGLVWELNNNPSRFKGKRILFIHTGGVYGSYDGRLNPALGHPGAVTNDCHLWMEKNSPPF